MKGQLIIVMSSFLLIFSACRKDENAGLTLNFQLQWDGNPLIINEKYDYSDSTKVFFDRVRFFIADATLISPEGDDYTLNEVDLIDFTETNTTLQAAQEGVNIDIKDLPTETFEGLDLNIGLTAAQNAKTPADFPIGHPLANADPYWSDWKSYIFVTVSGRADTNNDGIYETGLVYHLGGNESIVRKSFSRKIDLLNGENSLQFVLDLKDVFIHGSEIFDIKTINQVHIQRDIMAEMAIDFGDALQLK